MRIYTYSDTIQGKNFEFSRICKKKARAIFRAGLPLVFCPVNLRPGWPYHPEIVIFPARTEFDSFEAAVNAFEFYNCSLPECGKYTAFYIPVKTADRFTGRDDMNGILSYNYDFMEATK